ncbi:MAG: hypothetical protein HY825_16085 [Acidobacteria bacterium]|nr:hypothetical protein [Acidobacteriota bacterium]
MLVMQGRGAALCRAAMGGPIMRQEEDAVMRDENVDSSTTGHSVSTDAESQRVPPDGRATAEEEKRYEELDAVAGHLARPLASQMTALGAAVDALLDPGNLGFDWWPDVVTAKAAVVLVRKLVALINADPHLQLDRDELRLNSDSPTHGYRIRFVLSRRGRLTGIEVRQEPEAEPIIGGTT